MFRLASTLCALIFIASVPVAHAQNGVLLQGIADGELWSTDTGSNLLTRNDGKPGVLGRLDLWGAVELMPNLVAYSQGEAIAGPAYPEDREASIEQAGLRYSPSGRFVIDAGKITHPMGAFSSRRFSTRNPLIGAPDGYTSQYPWGAEVFGSGKIVDYRAAIVSLPLVHEGYVPEPGTSLRPVVGMGITPYVGFRIGASATWGSYLNDEFSPALLAGKSWKSYHERLFGADVQFSHDYFELRSEWTYSSYDVPKRADAISGNDIYIEAKQAVGPRLYFAARVERNRYPFVGTFTIPAGTFWTSSRTDFDNGEVGAGYRVTASTLVKFSYRADKWQRTPQNRDFVGPGGHAIGVQVSQSFDVLSLLDSHQ